MVGFEVVGGVHHHRHVADERWRLERNELAVLATLVLRGPQTTGELRSRTERLVDPDEGARSDTEAATRRVYEEEERAHHGESDNVP